jgi:hypothetical protein
MRATAGAFYLRRIDAGRGGGETGARRQVASGRCRGGAGRSGGVRCGGLGLRLHLIGARGGGGLRCLGCRCRGHGAFLDHRDQLLAGHGGACFELDFLEHAIDRRGHFQHDLVGFQVEQVLVALDRVAGLLVPGGDGGVGHGFGENRNFDFGGHEGVLSGMRWNGGAKGFIRP